ncbi:MAG: hemolysin III family protein [Neisseria sp.]|nr:hemolysin III family protein [Neisseria sp.]
MYHGERFNAYSHLIGTLLAIIGTVLLIVKAAYGGSAYAIVAVSLYGASLILLYSGSTIYHSVRSPAAKRVWQKWDHCAIYLLIAGSYTPFTLVTLNGAWGWSLFGVVWGLAIVGIVQDLTIGKKTRLPSLILYLLMGWCVLAAIKPLAENLATPALIWLVAGGIAYSVGVYWYVHDERIRHGHGIWHLFVLAGSICQFVCVYFWVV